VARPAAEPAQRHGRVPDAVPAGERQLGDDLLVKKLWITGGSNEHGEVFPGCWDADRGTWELPPLAGDVFVYATVDPSPTRWWGIQAWAYHPASERYFLLDLIRKKMQMSDFLDRDDGTGELRGLAVDCRSCRCGWATRSRRGSWRRTPSATSFYGFTEDGRPSTASRLIAHPRANKSDPKYGVQALGPLYRSGRVRLPGRQGDGSRLASLKLVDEVTKWPEGATDDQVMSQWFGFWNLKNIYTPYRRPDARGVGASPAALRVVACVRREEPL
jgi:hypothetical protein